MSQPVANPPDVRPEVIHRLAIVEDDEDLRTAVQRLIDGQAGWRCCAACASASEALRELPRAKPDLVLIDVQLPDRSGKVDQPGLDLVPKLRVLIPQARLVMLTVVNDTEDILRAIQDGACGYILKGGTQEGLLEQIQTVLAGGAFMSPSIARKLTEWLQAQRPSEPSAGFGLTEREWEVLGMTARGRGQSQIGQELGISRNTVRNHFQNIYAKFQVNNSAAVIYQVAPSLRIRENLRAFRQPPLA